MHDDTQIAMLSIKPFSIMTLRMMLCIMAFSFTTVKHKDIMHDDTQIAMLSIASFSMTTLRMQCSA